VRGLKVQIRALMDVSHLIDGHQRRINGSACLAAGGRPGIGRSRQRKLRYWHRVRWHGSVRGLVPTESLARFVHHTKRAPEVAAATRNPLGGRAAHVAGDFHGLAHRLLRILGAKKACRKLQIWTGGPGEGLRKDMKDDLRRDHAAIRARLCGFYQRSEGRRVTALSNIKDDGDRPSDR